MRVDDDDVSGRFSGQETADGGAGLVGHVCAVALVLGVAGLDVIGCDDAGHTFHIDRDQYLHCSPLSRRMCQPGPG